MSEKFKKRIQAKGRSPRLYYLSAFVAGYYSIGL